MKNQNEKQTLVKRTNGATERVVSPSADEIIRRDNELRAGYDRDSHQAIYGTAGDYPAMEY